MLPQIKDVCGENIFIWIFNVCWRSLDIPSPNLSYVGSVWYVHILEEKWQMVIFVGKREKWRTLKMIISFSQGAWESRIARNLWKSQLSGEQRWPLFHFELNPRLGDGKNFGDFQSWADKWSVLNSSWNLWQLRFSFQHFTKDLLKEDGGNRWSLKIFSAKYSRISLTHFDGKKI